MRPVESVPSQLCFCSFFSILTISLSSSWLQKSWVPPKTEGAFIFWKFAPVFIPTWIALAENTPLPRSPPLLSTSHLVTQLFGSPEEFQACRQSLQPLTNFCLRRPSGKAGWGGGEVWEGVCHRLLVSIPHLWTVTGACSYHPHPRNLPRSCLTGSRDQFPAASEANARQERPRGRLPKAWKKGKAFKKKKEKKKEIGQRVGPLHFLSDMHVHVFAS